MVFEIKRTVQEELEWMDGLRCTDAEAAENVLSNSKLMVELAAGGEVGALKEMIHAVDALDAHVLTYYYVKMFQEASLRRRMDVLKFMVDNGFDVNHPFVKDTLHRVIEECSDEHLDDTLQPLLHFLLQAQMDVNFQRKRDLFTPLHVACAKNFLGVASILVMYGADVNAIAKEDLMPLNCAERVSDEVNDKLVALLKDAGARRTWRRQNKSTSQMKIVSFSSLQLEPQCGLMLSTSDTD
ncbi:unnamed protein product [Aphanomyces euteiches]